MHSNIKYASQNLIIRQLGLQPYTKVLLAMQKFTNQRKANSSDEIWLVQHPRVFTQGHNGKAKHLLCPGDIPVIQSDRGGQITFHGPGQQIVYVMLDLHRRKLKVRSLIITLEQIIIDTLRYFNIYAQTFNKAPGVYVGTSKICSIGLKIYNGCSFHGVALNVAMDLSPFSHINPCGYVGLKMTQIRDLRPDTGISDVEPVLLKQFLQLS